MKLFHLHESPLEYHTYPEVKRKDATGYGPGFPDQHYKAWSSPKFLKQVKTKLARLANHNIVMIVGGDISTTPTQRIMFPDTPNELSYTAHRRATLEEVSKATNIPLETLKKSITVNLCGMLNGVDTASPWMIVHQITEALRYDILEQVRNNPEIYGSADEIDSVVSTILSNNIGVVDKQGWRQGGVISTYYHRLFKFKSAQSGRTEYTLELFTEYLWHGGRIRINQIPEIQPEIIQQIKIDFENFFKKILDDATGQIYDNCSE